MYEKILDECQVARSLVDVLRSITDAPLVLCVDAARAALACISPYIKDESFNKIEQAMKTYCIDVDNCYDSHCLAQIGEHLEQLFKEKEELCYSTRQDDIELIEYLTKFADYTNKTDPRIPMAFVSNDDFKWIAQLVTLFQMDQKDSVKLAALTCITCLVEKCSNITTFLVDSKLPSLLSLQIPSNGPLSEMQLLSVKLLILIYSEDNTPPLGHFDFFNVELFTKLYAIMEFHPFEVLDLMVNFNFVIPDGYDNVVLTALQCNASSILGQILIKALNKDCTRRKLRFLLEILKKGSDLVSRLFYSNDLGVLSNIVVRELNNSEDEMIRRFCLLSIGELVKMGNKNDLMQEAVMNCSFKDILQDDILFFLKT